MLVFSTLVIVQSCLLVTASRALQNWSTMYQLKSAIWTCQTACVLFFSHNNYIFIKWSITLCRHANNQQLHQPILEASEACCCIADGLVFHSLSSQVLVGNTTDSSEGSLRKTSLNNNSWVLSTRWTCGVLFREVHETICANMAHMFRNEEQAPVLLAYVEYKLSGCWFHYFNRLRYLFWGCTFDGSFQLHHNVMRQFHEQVRHKHPYGGQPNIIDASWQWTSSFHSSLLMNFWLLWRWLSLSLLSLSWPTLQRFVLSLVEMVLKGKWPDMVRKIQRIS